jgi:hypothetical protein
MSVWSDRDLRVLRHLHEQPPRHEMLSTNWQGKSPRPDLHELTEQDVHVAVETLVDEGLVSYRDDSWNSAGGVHWIGIQVTGAGLQALGEWPVFDMLTSPEELGLLLDGLAEIAATDEEESNLREAAKTARAKSAEAVRSLAAGALRALVRSQLG